jgi:CheY-like chemotaxis protein
MNSTLLHPSEAASDTRVRTLVVDDSPIMLKLLAQILEEAGDFELVGTATDGCQALRQVAALEPELVLMDFHLPHLNGIQGTRYIKDFKHPPIVIIVTSDESSFAKSMAEKAGADGFITKAGDLRHQLLGMLQDLFGPNGASRAAAGGFSCCNPRPSGITTHENAFAKHVTDKSSLRRTHPGKAVASGGTLTLEAHSVGRHSTPVRSGRLPAGPHSSRLLRP